MQEDGGEEVAPPPEIAPPPEPMSMPPPPSEPEAKPKFDLSQYSITISLGCAQPSPLPADRAPSPTLHPWPEPQPTMCRTARSLLFIGVKLLSFLGFLDVD